MGQDTGMALLVGAAAVVSLTVGSTGPGRAQPAQKVTGPVATYWMSAQTQTGFGMPGAGARPSASAMMNAMMGRGSGAQHSLVLQLGSARAADGEPEAEHLPPPGLQAGPSLPLLTPRNAAPVADRPEDIPRELARPKGRMLVFWGCGEHAKAGQPLVLDSAELSAGKAPAAFQALGRGIGVTPMQPPAPGRDRTYGEWPNERTRATQPAGSLVGEHVVRGDYTPEIRFSLTPAQDFLGPLNLTTNARAPSGAVQLGWGGVSGAQAYLATAVGGGQADTMVMWTSSEVQAAAFAMPDYIGPSDLARLVQSRVLLSPQTIACTVPKEVVDAAPSAMVQLVAYGGEANFVHPPRPGDPKVAWNREWQVKVRYRSATGGMLGVSPGAMDEAGDSDRGARPAGPQTPPPRGARTRSVLRGLGDVLGVPTPRP
jgi:hypothetical protein